MKRYLVLMGIVRKNVLKDSDQLTIDLPIRLVYAKSKAEALGKYFLGIQEDGFVNPTKESDYQMNTAIIEFKDLNTIR